MARRFGSTLEMFLACLVRPKSRELCQYVGDDGSCADDVRRGRGGDNIRYGNAV